MHKIKNPDIYKTHLKIGRFLSLETLALELTTPFINDRIQRMSEKNYSGIQKYITNSILKTGASLINKSFNIKKRKCAKKVGKKATLKIV